MSELDGRNLYEGSMSGEDSSAYDGEERTEETALDTIHPEAEEDYDNGMLVVRTSAEEPRYEELFDAAAPGSRILSFLSTVFGIISLALCWAGWWSMAVAAVAIILSLISRKRLKYFDKMSIAGLIIGIFGMVFGGAVVFVLYGPFADLLAGL